MALGIVRQLASGQHTQVTIPSGNYLWPTIRVLNPNDGVIYVKQNADLPDVGFGSWDYKVPSQSFGLLPGEGQGWQSVGLYYLDQSGANRPGEISIYLTQQNASDPVFQSIGRAAVTLSSSVDVASGNQPANPPAGYGRLWIDTGGHLNILQPSGTNFNVYDNTNIGTVSLGGDLYGTIANGHVGLRNNSWIYAYDTSNNIHPMMGVGTDNSTMVYLAGGNGFRWINQGNTVQLGSLDNSGNFAVNGTGIFGSNISDGGNIFTIQGAGQGIAQWIMSGGNLLNRMDGVWYWQNAAGSATRATLDTNGQLSISNNLMLARGNRVFWGDLNSEIWTNTDNHQYFDTWNAHWHWRDMSSSGAERFVIYAGGGVCVSNGHLYLEPTNQVQVWWDSSAGGVRIPYGNGTLSVYFTATNNAFYFGAVGGNALRWDGSYLRSDGMAFLCPGSIGGQGVAPSYCFTAPNAAAAYGQGYANAWINASSKDFKKNVAPIANPLGILLNPALRGVEYDHDWALEKNTHRDAISGTAHSIGFIADDWQPHVPHIVALDDTGKPIGMDYARVTALLWEGVREYITSTNARLDRLEAPKV